VRVNSAIQHLVFACCSPSTSKVGYGGIIGRMSEGPRVIALSEPGTKRIVWTTPSKQGRFGMCAAVGCGHVSGLRCAALGTAGPDAIRSLAPKQIYALEWRITLDGFFHAPGSTGSPSRHHRPHSPLSCGNRWWGFLRLQAAPPGTAAGMR
jgi:hypothetical protein